MDQIMTRTNQSRSRRPRPVRGLRSALLAASVGAAAALGGCGREEPISAAIQQASRDMELLAAGGLRSADEDRVRASYQGVLSTLRPVANTGTVDQQAAAALLMARAQLGLAALPRAEYDRARSEVGSAITEVEGITSRYVAFRSSALSNAEYDKGPEERQITEQIAELRQEQEQMRAEKQRVDTRVAQLRAEAEETLQRARREREQEGELRQQALTEPDQHRALEFMEGVRTHRRAADELDAEAATLMARADQAAPESTEIQAQLDRIENQLTLLDQAQRALSQRAEAIARDASAAAAEADSAEEQIDRLVQRAVQEITGPLSEKAAEAAQAFSTAADTARRARQGARNPALLMELEALLAAADVHSSHAANLLSVGAMLESLAQTRPALSRSAQYRDRAEPLARARRDSLQRTAEALRAAVQIYDQVSLSGDAALALEQSARRVRGRLTAVEGELRDLGVVVDPARETPETDPEADPETDPDGA
jgi:hypothetical protein